MWNSICGLRNLWKSGRILERNFVSIGKIQLEINGDCPGTFCISNLPTKDLYRLRYCYIIKAIIQ